MSCPRNAYKRAVLILKCFHTRERDILKLAFITYVRAFLEFLVRFGRQNIITSVHGFFTRRISLLFLTHPVYGAIYLLTQRISAVYASFLYQLVHATCLDFVQFILSDAFTVLTLSLIAH